MTIRPEALGRRRYDDAERLVRTARYDYDRPVRRFAFALICGGASLLASLITFLLLSA